jgi:hypothetical protein
MSIADFIANAKQRATITPLELLEDVQIEGFSLEELDKTTTARSISDSQYRALKLLIAEYRAEIMKGTFVSTNEKLHNIIMFYRVSREDAFVVIKEKAVKVKAPAKPRTTRAKKGIVLVDDLM